ncbi:nitric oxide reductase activation protein NorD [Bacillus sp. DNRA2]|uniref:vWA domain-containing protein n=1 Tax=Bacillus sp. DNRA2 TaxID=2723053 RepID=UPI00145F8FB1|nr:nitric oxide reductase activation protein NorD [Bacillus sp. DNRA2]NMD71702.1 nitric oxide reductase activation protein NorD [Bacillus sp. DNRA2]
MRESTDIGENGRPFYHPEGEKKEIENARRAFRKQLNQQARMAVQDSNHWNIKQIVHRPDYTNEQIREYEQLRLEINPIVQEIARKTAPFLIHEDSITHSKRKYYGTNFKAETVAFQDFRYFSRKLPPTETPSLVVALRVDESASMNAFGRLVAAKRAVLAVYEFCQLLGIPLLIYGDTADVSKLEQMSIFAYTDFEQPAPDDAFRLMNIRARSNNRDGMALRVICERLVVCPQQTKLIISISDGQPKAMPDYTGIQAIVDMQQTIAHFERKGITFLAAAIGQDQEIIQQIYGEERFLDMSDLKRFPTQLVRMISRYIS